MTYFINPSTQVHIKKPTSLCKPFAKKTPQLAGPLPTEVGWIDLNQHDPSFFSRRLRSRGRLQRRRPAGAPSTPKSRGVKCRRGPFIDAHQVFHQGAVLMTGFRCVYDCQGTGERTASRKRRRVKVNVQSSSLQRHSKVTSTGPRPITLHKTHSPILANFPDTTSFL